MTYQFKIQLISTRFLPTKNKPLTTSTILAMIGRIRLPLKNWCPMISNVRFVWQGKALVRPKIVVVRGATKT